MIIPEFPNHVSSRLNSKWPLIEATLAYISTLSTVKKGRVVNGLNFGKQSPNPLETSEVNSEDFSFPYFVSVESTVATPSAFMAGAPSSCMAQIHR